MKKYLFLILCVCMVACQVIPENEQTIPVAVSDGESSVLLIDFTGVGCVNCPLAATEMQRLLEAYPEQLVGVSMHPKSNPFTQAVEIYDYTAPEADEYYKYLGGQPTTSFPTGVVNFKQFDNDYFQDYSMWGTLIVKEINQPSKAKVTINSETNAATRQVVISTNVQANAGASLLLWLVEDNILGAQSMPDGSLNTQYIHNHMFRQSINGVWGETVAGGEQKHTIVIDEKYNIQNCAVVAVVMDESKQVVAASVSKLIVPTEESEFTLFLDDYGEIKTDTTITITEVEISPLTGKSTMEVNGSLVYNGTLWVDIEREDIDAEDQFCCGSKCINTNNEASQQLSFTVDGFSFWYTHFTPIDNKESKITYIFNSKSVKPLKLIINYKPLKE